ERKRLEQLAVVDRLGNENDAGRQARLQNIARDFEPALARQPDVQDDDIGRVRTHGRQRLWAVGRGGHNGEILDRTEEALEAQADDLVTLRNDEPDGLPGHELAVPRRPRAERSRWRASDTAHRRLRCAMSSRYDDCTPRATFPGGRRFGLRALSRLVRASIP